MKQCKENYFQYNWEVHIRKGFFNAKIQLCNFAEKKSYEEWIFII